MVEEVIQKKKQQGGGGVGVGRLRLKLQKFIGSFIKQNLVLLSLVLFQTFHNLDFFINLSLTTILVK